MFFIRAKPAKSLQAIMLAQGNRKTAMKKKDKKARAKSITQTQKRLQKQNSERAAAGQEDAQSANNASAEIEAEAEADTEIAQAIEDSAGQADETVPAAEETPEEADGGA
jgi:hypothetical protein